MSSSKSSIICIRRTTIVNPDWSFMQLGCWLIWAGCTACGFLKTKIIFFFHIFYIVQVGWLVAAVAGGKVCFVTLKANWPKKSFVAFSDFHNSIEFEINSIDAPPVQCNPQGQGLQAPYTPFLCRPSLHPTTTTNSPWTQHRAHILWGHKKQICESAQKDQKSSLASLSCRFKKPLEILVNLQLISNSNSIWQLANPYVISKEFS